MSMKEFLEVFCHAFRCGVPLHVVPCLALMFIIAVPAVSGEGPQDGTKEVKKAKVLMVPVSSLASENATTTVSVLRDSFTPATKLFDLCQSDQQETPREEREKPTKQANGLCQLLKEFAHNLDVPRNELKASDYLVTIPLKQPQDGVEAVTWRSKNLEGAIAFMDVLQGGKMKGVNVYSSSESGRHTGDMRPCSACPIKDLIFWATAIKEHKEFLEGREP